MKSALLLVTLLSIPASAQLEPPASTAKTVGPCSPAVSGNHNTFTIHCTVDEEQGRKMVEVLNKLLENQIDAQAMMKRLNACVAGISRWKLTPLQRDSMSAALTAQAAMKRPATNVVVDVIPNDNNAAVMALDLLQVLQSSGWIKANVGLNYDYALNPQIQGIVIAVSHQDFSEATRLWAILSQVTQTQGQLDAKKEIVPDDNTIVIIVGARPTPEP